MLRMSNLVTTARFTLFAFCAPMVIAGCGGANRGSAGENGTSSPPMQTQRPGMTGKQKVALLVGAAALYYVYKTHKEQTAQAQAAASQTNAPAGVQLYRSRKTGGIYWREPNNPQRVHWLTVPARGIEVPQSDYNQIMSQRNQWSNIPVHTGNEPPPGPGEM